jgi:hypothetical protein
MSVLLFPLGVRLSTWLAGLAFVSFAAFYRDRRFLFAGWAWLTGFEAVFQATALTLGHPLPFGIDGPIFYVLLGVITVAFSLRFWSRPSWRLMAVVAAIWVVWVATGFHVNEHHTAGLNPLAEVFNESMKTLWAVAYLLPLWLLARRRPRRPVVAASPIWRRFLAVLG